MTASHSTHHLALVTTPTRERPAPTSHPDSIPFPCPTCGAVFNRCGGGSNDMGVVDLALDCPNGHIWSMRYVSPDWGVA
jgi:hypothetical protein